MSKKTILVGLSCFVVLAGSFLFGAVSTWLGASPNQNIAEAVPEVPEAAIGKEIQILSTAEVMKLIVDPQYELVKDAIENPPEKRKEWRALYIAVFPLAEMRNLMYSRMDEPDYQSKPEWIEAIDKSMNIMLTFARSVRERADYEILKKNYLAVVASCNDCHNLFEPGEIDKIEPPTSWLDPDAVRGKQGPPL